jgi:hypothetical protein
MPVNFNALAREGPANFYEGLVSGQQAATQNMLVQQKMAQDQETNALNRQKAQIEMESARLGQETARLGQERTRGLMTAETEERARARRVERAGMFRDRLLRAGTPEAAREIVRMQYADPELAPVLSQAGTLDQALAEVPEDPALFQRYRQQEALGMSEWMKSQLPKVVGNAVYLPDQGRFATQPVPPKEPNEPPEVTMLNRLGLPVTLENIAQLKQAQAAPTQEVKDPLIRQYEYAQGQGFKGSLFDYKRSIAEAGRPPAAPRQPSAPAPLERVFDTVTNSQELVDRADIRANPGRYKPLGAEEKLRNIPETINKGLTGNVASISQIDRAIEAVTKNPSAVGLKGNLPQTILNKAYPEGVEARALVTDVGSAKVHDRSGAAVAASEAPRLMPFIPQATDDAETVIKKLKQLKTQIEIEQSGILDFYSQEQGYKPSLYHKRQSASVESAAPSAAAPAAAKTPSSIPKEAIDFLKKGLGTREQFDAQFGAGSAKRVLGN